MIDVPSILWGAVAVSALAQAALFSAQRDEPPGTVRRMLLAWQGMTAAVLAACVLFALRDRLPPELVLPVGNALILLGRSLLWAGLRALRDRPAPAWMVLGGPALWLVASLLPGVLASTGPRIALAALLATTYTLLAITEALRARREQGLRSLDVVILLLAGFLLIIGVRAAEALLLATPTGPGGGPVSSLLLLVLIAGSAFAGLAVARERAVMQQSEALRLAAERAASAERLARAMLENIGLGVVMWDAEGRLLSANAEASRLLDIPAHLTRPGASVDAVWAWLAERGEYGSEPAARDALLARVRGAAGDADAYERTRPDGTVLAVRTFLLSDGRSLRTLADVTESRRAAARLAAAQARLQAIVDSLAVGVLAVDGARRVEVMNRTALEMLGAPARLAVPGTPADELIRWLLDAGRFDDLPPAQAAVLQAGGRVRDVLGDRTERTYPGGRIVEVLAHDLPDGGRLRSFIDVTERKRNEAALMAARDAAEAAARVRTDFLAVMSHEIRTPLNGILGISALLAERTDLPADVAAQLRLLHGSGDHLMALLGDVLDFARLDAGSVTLEVQAFDPAAELAAVAAMLRAQAEEKGLRLAVEVAPGVPRRVQGDAGRVRQVLLNLLGNAVKFTDAGGITLALDAVPEATGRVRLAFAVSDTGIGIPEEDLPKLFQPFAQADASTARRFGGSGLGLVISRRLAALMGGAIRVESRRGEGSSFHFEVPCDLPAAGDESPPGGPASPAQAASRLQVLLVEDNAVNRFVATRMVERLGHAVTAVTDGASAVRAVGEGGYDLVLMDLMMPGMSGFDAARAIRALPGPRGRVPIIAASATATAEAEAACREAGMAGLVAKPLTVHALASAIARLGGGATAAAPGCDGPPTADGPAPGGRAVPP